MAFTDTSHQGLPWPKRLDTLKALKASAEKWCLAAGREDTQNAWVAEASKGYLQGVVEILRTLAEEGIEIHLLKCKKGRLLRRLSKASDQHHAHASALLAELQLDRTTAKAASFNRRPRF